MTLASLHFLLFGLVAAIGAGAIAWRLRGPRAGWLTGLATFLAFAALYLAVRQLVMVPLGQLE